MRNIIILPLVVMVLTASCQNVDIRKKMQKDYKQSVQFFEKDLVSHFPTKLCDSSGYHTNVLRKYNLAKLCFATSKTVLWRDYSKNQYFKLKTLYDSLANTTYLSSDTTLLLVFDYCDVMEIEGDIYRNQESPEHQALAKHNVSTATSLPVPLFGIDEYKGNTMSGLTEDFKLYVLDAKPGKYIDDKYLQECDCLPEKWKHGYSKGVALSDEKQVVIYWVIVW